MMYYTSSVSLAAQVQELARGLGLRARIYVVKDQDLQRCSTLVVHIGGPEDVWSTIPSLKVQNAEKLRSSSVESSDRLVRVSRVDIFDYAGWVYDVTSDSGVFSASGILTHNSGGFGELPPVKQLANLIRLPSPMPGRATISRQAGSVSKVKKTSEGTEVSVLGKAGEETHFIPPNRRVSVEVGDTVKMAQPLSSGIVDPREVMDVTGDLYLTQRSMVDSIADLYRKYKLRPKNYEVLVRSITNLAEVEDPGSSPYQKGDMVPFQLATAWNRENDSSLKVVPVLKGVTSLPQYRDDWLSALGYRNIKRILAEAAAVGEKASLRSLNPTPAMLMDPTGFGKSKTPEDPRY